MFSARIFKRDKQVVNAGLYQVPKSDNFAPKSYKGSRKPNLKSVLV